MPKNSEIVVGTRVDDTGLKKGGKKLSSTIDGLSKKFSSGKNSVTAFAGSMAVSAAAVSTVAVAVVGASVAIKKLADATAEYADNVGKASQRMDVSIEFYQKMESASSHAGTSMSTMESAMRTMLRTMGQVEDGNKRVEDVYKNLGVALKDSTGAYRDQESIFQDVLINLADVEDSTQRNIISQKLLGRSASQLAPLFNEGADAVRGYIKENESAVVVSQEMADSSARYNDSMQTVGETLKKAKNTALEPFMESMAELAEGLMNSEAFDSAISYINSLGRALSNTAEYANLLSKGFKIEKIEKMNDEIALLQKQADYAKEEATRYSAIYRKMLENGTAQRGKYNGTLETGLAKLNEEKEILAKINGLKKEASALQSSVDGKTFTPAARVNAIKDTAEATEELTQATKGYSVTLGELSTVQMPAFWSDSSPLTSQILDQSDGDGGLERLAEIHQAKINLALEGAQTMLSISSMVSDANISNDQKELSSWRSKEQAKLNGLNVSSRRKSQLQKKIDDETEKRENEIAKRRLKAQMAQNVASTALGVTGVLAQDLSKMGTAGLITAIGSMAFMTATGIAQGATIASEMQGLYTGGVIGGANAVPSSSGGDDTMIMGKTGERVLNAQQLSNLDNVLFGNGGGGSGITVNVENFSGNDDDLSRLENMLIELRENGRTI